SPSESTLPPQAAKSESTPTQSPQEKRRMRRNLAFRNHRRNARVLLVRRFLSSLTLFVLAALLFSVPAAAAGDPSLLYESLTTQLFRITFYSGEFEIARRIVDLAESILARLAPAVGWPPSERV